MPIVILPNVRLAFFHGWRPSDPRNGTDGKPIPGKYGAQGIWVPGSEADKMARAAFMEAATAKWGPNAGNVVRSLSKDKKCLRVGNEMLTKDGSIRDGYADMFYIASYNQSPPAIAAHKLFNGKPVLIGEDGRSYQDGKPIEVPFEVIKPYGGCYVNLKVDIYAMDKSGQGKSVNATFLAVQYVGKGDAFGSGGPGTADGFGDMGGDDAAYPPGTAGDAFDLFGAGANTTAAPAASNVDPLFG